MKEVIFNRKDYKNYKEIYEDICIKLGTDDFIDWKGERTLGYHADILNEFLWYCHDDNLKVIFIGFDVEKISQQKTYDDYELYLIIKIFKRLSSNYPNNSVEFRDE